MSAKWKKVVFLLFLDVIAINFSYFSAIFLRFEFNLKDVLFQKYALVYVGNLIIVTMIKLAVYYLFDLYKSLWKYASTTELIKIVGAAVFASAAATAYFALINHMLPRSVLIVACLIDILLIGGIRFSYRILRRFRKQGFQNALQNNTDADKSNFTEKRENKRIMIVGAGDAGSTIIKEIQFSYELGRTVVVAVDDDPRKLGQKIHGVNISGTIKDINALARKYRVNEIVIAIPSAERSLMQRIIKECNETKCKVKTLPGLSDLLNDKVSVTKLRDVDILDLLERDAVSLDISSISNYLENKVVLVTGGGGSIGSELCRQIAKFKPRILIALDVYENSVFALDQEMHGLYPELCFEVAIASVRNYGIISDIFDKYKPQVVFHAAAHKHVPLMESNPKEAVMNNFLGTKTVADIADAFGTEKFVLISTDKAVNPTNVMGATKRASEFVIQDKSKRCVNTIFSAVRFGNVLGSNGSALLTFKKQIEQGGPVTVTHPEITRYFMTIPEAVQLVMQTGAMASGGEIFILDMGKPVKIIDLAKKMIELSGYKPDIDIDICITGLRPGEKLFEELLLAEEGITETNNSKIFVGQPIPMNSAMQAVLVPDGSGIDELNRKLLHMTDEDVKNYLAEIVPTYKKIDAM